jgi:hypothetical protein
MVQILSCRKPQEFRSCFWFVPDDFFSVVKRSWDFIFYQILG